MTIESREQSAKNAHSSKQELREKVRSIFQSETKNLWRSPDYDEFPVPNYEDDIVQLLTDTVNKVLDETKKSIKNKIASRASDDFYYHDKLGMHPPKQTNAVAVGNTDWIIDDTIEQVRKEWSDGE